MDSWLILVLLGSTVIHVGANNTTTGKLSLDKAGFQKIILLLHLITQN